MINIAPSSNGHSSVHFFHTVSILLCLKKRLLSKSHSSCLIQYHNNLLFFLLCIDTTVLYSKSECMIQHTVQILWLIERRTGVFGGPDVRCQRKEKVKV